LSMRKDRNILLFVQLGRDTDRISITRLYITGVGTGVEYV
jgi:hypothetical protein